MSHLLIIVATTVISLIAIQIYAKWQIKKLSKKASSLQEEACEKNSRIKKIEELTRNKLETMSYAEQITRFISDGIVVANKEKILYCNPALLKISGYSFNEITNTSWKNLILEKDFEETVQALANNFENQIHVDGIVHFVNRLKCKNGSAVSLWWTITPFDENGIFYAVCRDVTRENGKKESIEFLLKKLLGEEFDTEKSNSIVKFLSNDHENSNLKKVANE